MLVLQREDKFLNNIVIIIIIVFERGGREIERKDKYILKVKITLIL